MIDTGFRPPNQVSKVQSILSLKIYIRLSNYCWLVQV